MWKYLSSIILKHRVLIILVILGLTIFMANKGQEAQLSYTMAKLLPSDHESSKQYNAFLDKYGTQNVFIIAISNDKIGDYNQLSDLHNITEEIKGKEGVKSILSLTNLPILSVDHGLRKFSVNNLFSDTIKDQTDLDKVLNNLYSQPFYKDFLNTSDNKVTTLMIELEEEIIKSPDRKELIDSIKDLVEKYAKQHHAETYFSGLPYIRIQDSVMVRAEIINFIFLALIITSLILFLFFRSFKATLSSMITVIVGVIFCFGSIVLLGYEISIFMALVPPLIIVIGIPNCIFLINKFHN